MRDDITKNKLFNRRIFILGGIHLIIASLFTTRLYYLQIKKNQKYKTLSDSNRIKIIFTTPFRGKILDKNGVELATNKISYKVLCELQYVDNVNNLIEELVKITKIPVNQNLIDKIKSNKNQIITIYNEVSWQALSSIEFHMEKLSGIYIAPFYKRYYPFGNFCSHVVGYTKTYNQNEYLNQSKYKAGLSGIEYHYDENLKGTPGIVEQEVDAKRRIIRELSHTISKPGNNTELTIDIHLQKIISQMLGNDSGAVAVIEINTGNVLALCSSPSYDNNMFINGFSHEDWQNVNSNMELPLINRVITLQTEPASTFKVVAALAALKDEIITPETEFLCEGGIVVGDTEFRCWQHKGHGLLRLDEAIATSCNSYFYNIGQRINIDSLVDMAHKFGFGRISNLGLSGEVSGMIPNKNWRRKKLRTKWQLGDTLNIVIGHGYILVTPIQLAVLAARIASGREVVPNLELASEEKVFPKLNINFEHLKLIQNCMFNVVNSRMGTASQYLRRMGIPSMMKMAGKTGSAQVISTKGENVKLLQQEKKNKDHGIFIGYGPFDHPKYAVSVFMGHIGGAGRAAVIAQQIFNHIKKLDL